MSTVSDLDLNLDNLFQPAWAQGKTETNKFAKFTGNEGVKPERTFSGKPGERRAPRRDGAGGGGFGGGERRSGFGGAPRGGGSKFGERQGGFRGGDRRDDRREERPAPLAPLPELNVAFIPEERGVEQLARQIKVTGRAYPLFKIALLILQKAERYSVLLTKKSGAAAQPLFTCALDETPWTNEDEAVAHVLKNHFATFYTAERTATEPPKGVYTFVAQCGLSGEVLGPPNHHDYQNQLRKLHAEKFSRMPFDMFKARVKIVKDEAVVKKWIEDQSFKTEYVCLNVPEPLRLATLEEVEKHFRATHKDSIIKPVESLTVAGLPSRSLRDNGLQRLIRQEWEQQKFFPLPIATKLSQQFAQYGLQFFKVNKTVTHVSVARPTFLDIESNPVSDGIKRIVDFINATPKCTRKKLVEALAPTPKVTLIPIPEAPVAAAPVAEGEAAATAPKPAEPKAPEQTPEQTAVMVDLHWLIHQGAVLEFADGRMETAKKPLPKPPKPEKKAAVAKPTEEAPAATTIETVTPEQITAEPGVEIVAPAEAAAAPVAEAPVQPEAPLAAEGSAS